jgi:hypothetical protein
VWRALTLRKLWASLVGLNFWSISANHILLEPTQRVHSRSDQVGRAFSRRRSRFGSERRPSREITRTKRGEFVRRNQ